LCPTADEEPGRAFALSEELFAAGACGEHIRLLEAWLTSPVQLDRSGVTLQAAGSWKNIKATVRRFLGFAAARDEDAASAGLLNVLDGPKVISFVAWMLHSRDCSLPSCVQSMLALEKTASFALAELLPEDPVAAAAYASRIKCLRQQIQTWHVRCPTIRPTFAELGATGKFYEMGDILSKALPWSQSKLDEFTAEPNANTARGLRQACVLLCSAGDAFGNVRCVGPANSQPHANTP